MNMEFLRTGVEKYNTPFYVFNLDEMAESFSYFKQKLGSSAGICFAIKANPFLTGRIAEMVDRIEVCSMGEFEITVVKSGRCICFWYGIRFILGKENFREREDLLRDSQKKGIS